MADISVIVPVHCKNEQDLEWLDECLGSIVFRNANIEVIAWDDGSVVDLSCVKAKHDKVVWDRNERNSGVSFTRNRAAEVASNSLLFPLDCDDVLVPGAISKLLAQWDGVPLYPDIYKFGDENDSHYELLDFTCKHIISKVGVASVGVLHSKEQWKTVGGWDESLDFYEDGEYNARLMLKFCGRRVPEPLYGYRIHSSQRTKLNKDRSAQVGRKVLAMIRSYERSLDMSGGCCPGSGSRRTPSNSPAVATVRSMSNLPRNRTPIPLDQRIASLPGSSGGKVEAYYVGGKGRGTHYYRGPATKFAYKVKHDGVYNNIDARDVRDINDPSTPQHSLLILIERSVPSPVPQLSPTPEPSVRRKPKTRKKARRPKSAVTRDPIVEEEDAIPDISNISYRRLVTMDITPQAAKTLLKIEQEGRARVKHLAYLKRRVRSDS